MNLPTKSEILTHPECRAFAAGPRHFSGFWPRALARGLSWSVHLGACFWKFDPGSKYWDMDITWKSSYLDFVFSQSLLNEFPSHLWLLCTSCKSLGLDRILSFPKL